MNVKLTIEFVRSEFKKEGYILLTKTYINAFGKLEYICPKGHIGITFWNNWQQKRRCLVCAGKKKLTLECVKNMFEKEGYILISTKYINSKSKLDYICSKGHVGSINLSDWRHGYRCLVCSGKKKHTLEFVKKEFEKYNYKLTSVKYINAHSKLEYVCPKGHTESITWGNWKHGYRCPTCDNINRMGSGNSNWKGGISCEPYCQDWTKEFKGYIKERDGYRCLNPYCNSKNPNDLTIHHVNYDKKLCIPENLITVCRSCNVKANFDRDWHTNWYQAILNKRYGHIYNKKIKNNKGEINYVRSK